MSIASELNRLLQAKSDLATSITNKGVTVPAATTIDGYAALVDQIQQGGTLPYDAEIEYLESTGLQWIDTGIKTWHTMISMYTEMAFTDINDARELEGAGNAFTIGLNNKRHEIAYQAYYGTADTNFFTSQKTLVRSDSSAKFMEHVWINNVNCRNTTYNSGYSTAVNTNVYVFASSAAATLALKCKKKSFRLIVDSLLVRDFIPVRVGTVGYLYDKVSKTLFGNAGTGSFVLGPDVT